MAYAFYRKESEDTFLERFVPPSSEQEAWSLRSSLVLQAPGANRSRLFRVQANGRTYPLLASVSESTLIVQNATNSPAQTQVYWQLTEEHLALAIAGHATPLLRAVAKTLCEEHNESGARSPFISGSITGRSAASEAGAGHDLFIELTSRQPFVNPWAPSPEREHLLIGHVSNAECRQIRYLGQHGEPLNERVAPCDADASPRSDVRRRFGLSFFGGRIARRA